MTISLVVGYLNYRLGQVRNGHLLYVYFGSDWGTVVKIALLGTIAALFRVVVWTLLPFQFLHSAAVQFIPSLKIHFIPPPQTPNGHTKKGTGSLVRLLGGTTAKWLQIGAALTFLSNTPSLIIASNAGWEGFLTNE